MTDRPQLRDYSRSRAVAIGTWEYAHLDQIPAAEHSLHRMSALLTGPLCGWPQKRLILVENEPDPGRLPDRLMTAYDGITDVALFYFVGHGQIAWDDQLCLGLKYSHPQPNRRPTTSLRFSDVRQALQNSEAAVKIVILDCCFAGLATPNAMADTAGKILDLTDGTGAYTMAATSAHTTAWYQDEPGLVRPQTYFTKYLVDLVEQGIPGQPYSLQLDVLFRQLRENLAADRRPEPQSRNVNNARHFAFAYNAAPLETHHDPDQEIKDLQRRLAEGAAREGILQAKLDERTRELDGLRVQARESPPQSDKEERQLQDAIQFAAVRRDEAAAEAHAAVTARPDETDAGEGNSPDKNVPLAPEGSGPRAGRRVSAEWALWGKQPEDTGYSVLRWSRGAFGRGDFREIITRYTSGVTEVLPQYTVCWIPEGNGHEPYLAVGLRELADPDSSRSGDQARYSSGRLIEYIRFFCVPYSAMAENQVSYTQLVESVINYRLPGRPYWPNPG